MGQLTGVISHSAGTYLTFFEPSSSAQKQKSCQFFQQKNGPHHHNFPSVSKEPMQFNAILIFFFFGTKDNSMPILIYM